jgi:hypothetical protein
VTAHRELLREVSVRTAALLQDGQATIATRPEERLREAMTTAFAERPEVVEVRREWQPAMPWWPAVGTYKLGGFDLALRFTNDPTPVSVAELKWCSRLGVDAFDEVLWDCFKLAHARASLDGISSALLVYAAPAQAWNFDGRFRSLFTDSLTVTETLLTDHRTIWEWAIRTSSKSRPTRLPPAVQTGLIEAAAFVFNGSPWELRVIAITPNGEPWIELSNGSISEPDGPKVIDWPYPEPGPGMEPDDPADDFHWPTFDPPQVPNNTLRPEAVPGPSATWAEITWFADYFDGYAHAGGTDELSHLGNRVQSHYESHGTLPNGLPLDDLRACLFSEYRRHHFMGHTPDSTSTTYIRALIEEIREALRTAR